MKEVQTQTDLLSDLTVRKKFVLPNSRKILVIVLIVLFMALNLFLGLKIKSGSNLESQDDLLGFSIVIFGFVPIFAFVLSLPISLIPYNKVKYSKKYLPFGLLILLVLQVLLCLFLLLAQPMHKAA